MGSFYIGFIKTGESGSDISPRVATLESEKPELVLVGNSLLRAAVDGEQFSELSDIPTTVSYSNGSSSLWWYLYVKNVVCAAQHSPQYVGILFRDAYLTEPRFRVDGNYQKPIRRMMTSEEPLVETLSYSGAALSGINSPLTWVPREARGWVNLKIEKRVEDLLDIPRTQGRGMMRQTFADDKMVADAINDFQLGFEETLVDVSFDFSKQVSDSYLPHIINLLTNKGITPVFIRARRRSDLSRDDLPQPIDHYIADLSNYIREHEGVLIDLSRASEIQEQHFGSGDHLTKTDGRVVFMKLLSDELQRSLELDYARTEKIAAEAAERERF